MSDDFMHITKATSFEDFKKLNPNSLETSCRDCHTYYTKEWAESEDWPKELLCPNCGSNNHGAVGSPAGGEHILLHMDLD